MIPHMKLEFKLNSVSYLSLGFEKLFQITSDKIWNFC